MASTSFSLGPYWDDFIKAQVAEGRYGSATEVVREALRRMEEDVEKLKALRAHVDVGIRQAEAGQFVDDFSVENVVNRALERSKQRA